ncbi:TRAP transporter small permease [Salipiger mangrovisoli]|uniref:TRAP transporter small permease protein n=1 Tax=Salipiger mangrovisoli TaxID=2865933 RepID=A0ABR9XA53_9RHOB|nr:TRAP transporter small permease [Salipiger mangrovisoli]MBE9640468.1 TRAP transporter small permease [Salipiger mangrovisoli]
MSVNDNIDALIDAQERDEVEQLKKLDVGLRDLPALLIFLALFVTVFLQFFTRYVLNDSLAFTEELARYLLIVLTFVAAIRCQLRDSHIRLELVDGLAAKFLKQVKLLSLVLSTVFFGVFAYALWGLASKTWRLQMISLPFPKYYLYAVVMIALVILVAVHVRQFLTLVLGDRK